jgi:hypothetical protein
VCYNIEKGIIMGKININTNNANSVYSLGVIGAAVYFIGNATTFWMGIVGFLKAIVWPAFLVYELFKFLSSQNM